MKTASLLVSAVCVHLSLSPPNPPVRKEECYCHQQKESTSGGNGDRGSGISSGFVSLLFETFIQYITFCSKVSIPLFSLKVYCFD
jgi:hypothetical protein